jgi:hypothetical protein
LTSPSGVTVLDFSESYFAVVLDLGQNLLDHDPKTKMSRSEYKEQERTSKSHTQNEDEKEKKGNYMFSMMIKHLLSLH